jgi:2-hydroxy-3-oxopropionate reductase
VAMTLEGLSEALVLGSKAAGIPPERILEVLSGGLAASRVIELRGPNMASHSFEPGFTIELHHKDLGIALQAARESGVALPGTALVDQMMASLRQRDHGGSDHSALLVQIERLSEHSTER